MSRLMLGAGEFTAAYQRAGWVVLDGCADYGADHVAIVPPLPDEIRARSWSLVCGVHFIEHLFYQDALILIGEIYEVLEDDGRLILEQANLEKTMRYALGDLDPPVERYAWMNGDPSWFGMRNLYPQPDQMNGNELMGHRWGYTPESLIELVASCGWQRDKISITRALRHVVERDFKLVAVKK